MLFLVSLDISDLYSFDFIVLLNPAFNCHKSLLSFSVDKVTNGTYNVVSVILNVVFAAAFIARLAGLSPCVSVAVCVIISVRTQF